MTKLRIIPCIILIHIVGDIPIHIPIIPDHSLFLPPFSHDFTTCSIDCDLLTHLAQLGTALQQQILPRGTHATQRSAAG